jgi:arsenate reductase (thioredoxin)
MGMQKTTLLFLCTGNSCRSQMAEGWAKALKKETVESWSAGIKKHGLNPLAVKVMAEAGVDISKQESNLISELNVQEFDWVITLCGHADETCPFFAGKRIHVGFDDPPKLAENETTDEEKLVHYRRVRDEIKEYILSLPDSLTNK